MPAPDFNLYLVTDRTQTRGRDLFRVLEQALDGGVQAVQLREKDLSGKALFELAGRCQELCARYRAGLFINDRIDVALAAGAAGVQLGKTSFPVQTARGLLGAEKSIGYSAHSLEEAKQAEKDGADFVLFGPVYSTPSKAIYGPPQGLEPLKELVAKVSIPVYAIGGIGPEQISAVRLAGVRRVALISAVLGAPEPRAAARALVDKLKG